MSENEAASLREPLVTVIVPSHNYAHYLPDALASVRAQTFQDWECLVIDDGSTDETAEVLRHLAAEDRRILTFSQPRRGVSAARNVGLRHARAAFIQFLDADDLLHPAKLEAHAQTLVARSDVDIVYGSTIYFAGDTPELHQDDRDVPAEEAGAPTRSLLTELLVANPMTIESPLIRRSILTKVGWFNERLERMEDWELWLRAALGGARFLELEQPAPLAFVRLHEGSASHDKVPMLFAEIQVRRRVARSLTLIADRRLNQRRLDEVSAELGALMGSRGEPLRGLRYLAMAAVSGRRPEWIRASVKLMLRSLPGGSAAIRGLQRARRMSSRSERE